MESLFRRLAKWYGISEYPRPRNMRGQCPTLGPIVLWHAEDASGRFFTRPRPFRGALEHVGRSAIEGATQQPGESWKIERKRGPIRLVFGSPWSLTAMKQASGESLRYSQRPSRAER